MNDRARKLLSPIASFGLAAVLLYLALRSVSFAEVAEQLQGASWGWLIPMAVFTLLSHFIRAWRWTLLVDALPEAKGRHSSTRIAFYSIMIGYMVNYVTPRLGEIVRTVNLSRREKLSFSAVFGTVVIERVLDVVILALAMIATGFLLMDKADVVQSMLFDPIAARLPAWAWWSLLATGITGGLVGLYVLYRLHTAAKHAPPDTEPSKLMAMLFAFQAGIVSLFTAKKRGLLIGSTFLIWGLYVVMTHIPFFLFDLAEPYQITFADALCVMAIGALGILVPAPGGIGSYHYIVILALTTLYGIPQAAAAAYALLSHAGQMILYTVTGALSLGLQGLDLATLRADASQADANPATSMPQENTPSI